MLNDEKIKQMTELALFEKNKGEQMFEINAYFKKDYVGKHMLQSFFIYTFCYFLIMTVVVLYNLEDLMSSTNPLGIFSIIYILIYFIGLGTFEIIAHRFYSEKYDTAQKNLKTYIGRLNILGKRFDNKDKAQNNGG